MDKKIRFTILGLVFVLATLFFWSALQQALVPSQAQSAVNLKVYLRDKTLECNKNGLCLAYLFGSSDAGVKIAGIQGAMTFSDKIEPIGLIQDGVCSSHSFELDRVISFNKSTVISNGGTTATFAVGTLKADALLKEGNNCIAAVILQPRGVTTIPDQATFALADSSMWKAGGTGTVTVGADTSAMTITINDTAPIPPVTPPTMPPPTAGCTRSAQGDCNCDSKVDLIDWDVLRSAFN